MLKKIILVIIISGLFPIMNAQQFVNLSEMEVSLGQQTYSAAVVNKSASGESISIAGTKFSNGVV